MSVSGNKGACGQFKAEGGVYAYAGQPPRSKTGIDFNNPILVIYKNHINGKAHKKGVHRITRDED